MTLKKGDLLTVGILLAGTMLTMLNQTALNPALPVIMADLGIDAVTVQWLVSAYSLANAIVIPLSAFLLGRFSVRRLFIGAICLFMAGTVIAMLAPSFWFILLGRILQAFGAGVTMPMMFSVILLIFPREKRGSAMGIVTLAMCFAPAIGPTVSGLLLGAVGWRGLFACVCALALLVVGAAVFKLRTSLQFDPTSFDKVSVVLCAAGLLCLLYGFSTISSTSSWLLTIGLMLAGIVLLALFVLRQKRLEVPLLNMDVLKVRNFRVTVVIAMVLQGTLISLNVVMPLYIQGTCGYPAVATGLAMMPGALLGGAASILAGRLFDRYGARKCVVPGILLVFAGTGCLLFLQADTSIYIIAIAYTVFPVAQHFTQTPMNTWGVNSLDDRVIQHGNALMNTLNQVAASLMTALLVSATAFGSTMSPAATPQMQGLDGQHLAFAILAAISALAAVVIIAFVKDRSSEPSAEASFVRESIPAGSSLGLGSPAGTAMNADPYYLLASATIKDAIGMLVERKTGGMPVVDDAMHVVGFISDGDIMKYLGQREDRMLDASLMMFRASDTEPFDERLRDLLDLKVTDLATSKVVMIDRETPMEAACTLLARNRLKKLPVTESGKLVGTLSRADVIRGTMSQMLA